MRAGGVGLSVLLEGPAVFYRGLLRVRHPISCAAPLDLASHPSGLWRTALRPLCGAGERPTPPLRAPLPAPAPDPRGPTLPARLPAPRSYNPDGHCGVHAMDVSPGGRYVVTGGRAAEDCVVLRREGLEPVQTFSVRGEGRGRRGAFGPPLSPRCGSAAACACSVAAVSQARLMRVRTAGLVRIGSRARYRAPAGCAAG